MYNPYEPHKLRPDVNPLSVTCSSKECSYSPWMSPPERNNECSQFGVSSTEEKVQPHNETPSSFGPDVSSVKLSTTNMFQQLSVTVNSSVTLPKYG